ncbi:MAG: SusC/RagA family TonB-linked outer membrane protein, partial [Gemmatimonadota bacterium]|nr:SusC/RagA family TonB-linked outer membrane protein [Gemmatimonadota bacterium]
MSEQQAPLEGVNVLITELNISVGTNAQGRYRIVIPSERVRGQTVALRVRFIGFTPEAKQIVIRAGEQTVDFVLKTDVQHLSAVVTTGVTAGTEQAKLPFNVAQVNMADIPVPSVNPLSELAGKVPGAQIVQSSGRPGAQPSVLLRGPKSINASGRGQDPLYILDGVILTGGLPDINPLDIENIEVVPGAAAASLYGARAGNGVISITTRSGKSAPEGVKFAIRSEYGVSDIERRIGIAQYTGLQTDESGLYFCQTVNGQPLCPRSFDYKKIAAIVNNAPGDYPTQFQPANGAVPGFPIDPGSTISGPALREYFQANRWPGQTYNAVDQFVKPQPFLQTDLDMTGKFGGTNLFASVGQVGQGGSIRFLNGYKRNSLRLNADQRFGDAWTLGLRTYYARSSSDGQNQEEGGGAFFRLTRTPPIVNLLQRDTLNRLFIRPNLQGGGQQNENPLYQLENIARQDVTDRFIGGATLRYAPVEWADLEGNFSYDLNNVDRYQFFDKGFRTTTSTPTTNAGSLFRGDINSRSYNTSINLTLRKDVGKDLRLRTSFRYLYDQQDVKPISFQGRTLAVAGVPAGVNITEFQSELSTVTSVRDIGAFAGLNVEYKERYIFDGLIRRDGSSLFGAANRWSNFGRASLAWRVAQEPWFHIKAINDLKLRGSFGTAGGRPNFTAQYETLNINSGGILSLNTLGNRNLRPEVTSEVEGGFDLGLFDRISLNVTYSKSDTKDQILPVPQPAAAGFGTRWLNAGTLQNKTFEAALSIPVIERKNFSWTSRFTYDRNRAVVTKLDVAPFQIGTNLQATDAVFRIAQGERYGTFYGRYFLTNCSQLPAAFRTQCGPTGNFQINDDGYVVWTGGQSY